MFDKLRGKLYPTIERLAEEILSGNFDEESAKSIVESGNVNVNLQNEDGDTLLHICLKNKKYIEAIWLIHQNADTNIENNDGLTAQRLAVHKGSFDVVNTLISSTKINVDQLDKNQRSLLQDAVISGHSDVANLLMQYSKNINSVDNNNRNVIFDAISYGDDKITNKLIENDDIDLNVIDNTGKTILHSKEVEEDDELAIKLLKNGANPTICDRDGNNFLLKITLKGKAGEAILKVAIRMGCDLNAKVSNKNSILMEVMYAFSKIPHSEALRRSEFKNMAKQLIKQGIDVKAINNNHETALFDLVRSSDIEGCAFVVENGININQVNKNKETALSLAILPGVKNLDIVILLLQYGANPLVKNRYKQTLPEVLNNIILHTHSHKIMKNNEIIKSTNSTGNYLVILKEILGGARCSFDYLDSTGNPLFFTPFLYDHLELTKLYLKIGVDINIKNKAGYTLFYLYVLSQFEKGEYTDKFRPALNFLIANRANILSRNKKYQTVFSMIPLIKNCNLNLFRQLIEITRYDYTIQDNRGRTIMHSCVWGDNLELINIIYGVERNIQNIPDNYNILPITYAALLGNKEIVKEFLRKGSEIKSKGKIPKLIITNFKPMLKNLEMLVDSTTDIDYERKIDILVDGIKRDFGVEEESIN